MLIAGIILAATYLGVAFTRLPRVNIDRPAAALSDAVLMVLFGVLTFDEAVSAIDFSTIAFLFGMLLLMVVLKQGGFFTLLARRTIAVASSPGRLMVTVVIATAVASALLVNDIVVLLFTPVVIGACRSQRMDPVPYFIGEAMASNIGSDATIVVNPQNMLIGVTLGISFARFSVHLAPVTAGRHPHIDSRPVGFLQGKAASGDGRRSVNRRGVDARHRSCDRPKDARQICADISPGDRRVLFQLDTGREPSGASSPRRSCRSP
ncbi:MAG: SLC13 family permease, partial [Chloroflexi bacterium]|nr:SLC13 family permease [Chloroflexota bacterium]